jgi:NAD-dependent deacetylase
VNEAFQETVARLRNSRRVTALTGAGISAESGVPTFRGADGLWKNFRAEELATPGAFQRDPRLVWEWYDWRRGLIAQCRPNAGHETLARWETRFDAFTVGTQNVDGLHRRAGSRNVHYLHGDIWIVRCVDCGSETVDETVPLPELPPRCACGGTLRPGVVWFGEALPEDAFQATVAAVEEADVVLVVGTSGLVYPAAGLPALARRAGAFVVEINPVATPLTPGMDAVLAGPSGEVLPRLDAQVFPS